MGEVPEPGQEVVHTVGVADEGRAAAEMRPKPPRHEGAERHEYREVCARPGKPLRSTGFPNRRLVASRYLPRPETANHSLQRSDLALERHTDRKCALKNASNGVLPARTDRPALPG